MNVKRHTHLFTKFYKLIILVPFTRKKRDTFFEIANQNSWHKRCLTLTLQPIQYSRNTRSQTNNQM